MLIKEEQMQFIKFITITVVLLSTSLVFAEGEVSTSVMNSEIKKGIIENPDGSFTIYEPRMLRGNTKMPIVHYNGYRICALFGFNLYLSNTRIMSEQTVAKSVKLNIDGSYLETKTNKKPYKEITCANEGEFKATPKTAEITNNPDGSVTIYEPRMLRGNKEMPLYSTVGTCALYGYSKYLEDTVIRTEQIARSISLNDNGSYYTTYNDEKPLKEITCANEGEFKAIPKTAEITNNPDGSVTIYEPRMLRGNKEMPLYSTVGTCALYGYSKYLEDTVIRTEQIARSISLNDNGSYYTTYNDEKPLKEITCANEGEFKAIPKTAEITNNPDGSVTIYEPRMLRGNKEMPLYSTVGTCALYGYSKYLEDTVIRTEQIARSISLNDNGSYYTTYNDEKPLKEITCYNDGDEIISIGTYCKNCN